MKPLFFIYSNCFLRKITSLKSTGYSIILVWVWFFLIFNDIKDKFNRQTMEKIMPSRKSSSEDCYYSSLYKWCSNINGLTVIIRRKILAFMAKGFLPIYSAPETVWNFHWSDLILRILFRCGTLTAYIVESKIICSFPV